MGEYTPLSVLEQLEVALVEPEPMCLVMMEIETRLYEDESVPESVDDEVLNQAGVRLREMLRRYDEMIEVTPNSWALILRTLADATVLAGRMRTFFEIVSEPYIVHGEEIDVQVVLGAAVRIPQDAPGGLVDRVERAMDSARSAGAIGPVVV